jgi:hypothetical protein
MRGFQQSMRGLAVLDLGFNMCILVHNRWGAMKKGVFDV